MGIREITGYLAHLLLAGYWLWVVFGTAPQLRRGSRGQRVRGQVLLIKTIGVGVTALVIGVIHFWATDWWQVIVAVLAAIGIGMVLRRFYRRLVAVPRHRRSLTHRGRTFERSRRVSGI